MTEPRTSPGISVLITCITQALSIIRCCGAAILHSLEVNGKHRASQKGLGKNQMIYYLTLVRSYSEQIKHQIKQPTKNLKKENGRNELFAEGDSGFRHHIHRDGKKK
jgi:hypothetical protein